MPGASLHACSSVSTVGAAGAGRTPSAGTGAIRMTSMKHVSGVLPGRQR